MNTNTKRGGKTFEDVSPAVLAQFREGNHEAYQVIHRMYYDGIKGFIYALTKSATDTEDILQNIFLDLWERHEAIAISTSMRSYLYRAAKNAVMDYFRRNKVRSGHVESSDKLPLPGSISSEEAFIARETEVLVQLALMRMAKVRRQVFEMSRYQGLTNDQIAKKLNLSPSTVSSHIHNVKKELKEIIGLFLVLFVLR